MLLHQLRSPLLGLLVVAAVASDAVGELPGDFFIALAALALAYLVLIELGKRAFYAKVPVQSAPDKRGLGDGRRHLRRPRPTSAMCRLPLRGDGSVVVVSRAAPAGEVTR